MKLFFHALKKPFKNRRASGSCYKLTPARESIEGQFGVNRASVLGEIHLKGEVDDACQIVKELEQETGDHSTKSAHAPTTLLTEC